MNTPEDAPEETIKGINAADLLARGLESAKAATGNPQAWQPPTPEELAALLPQYEIESLLGRGGMGAVYRGKQAALDRAVAIKLLPAELAADAEFMSRFQREARTLAKLQHPGIVAVHDFGQTSQGHLYFVMEFVNGTDLSRLIHGPGVNAAQALEIITQVCEALQYAHGQGVIHRDIKPANVLINTEGRAKLADFGLARPTSEETASLTRSNVVMGTPDYMAPEQMAGTADHRADLYALGVMLYEMLTGQTPRGAWAPPSQRVQVDVRLDQVVVRALQQDPAMRYQQASEIKTDVDVIRTTPLPKPGKAKVKLAAEAPGQRTTPLPKQKKPANKLAIAAAIVLPLLAVAGWWVVQQRPESMASNLPWQKAVWSDQDRASLSADGWLTTGDELKSSGPRRVPGEPLKFADGALRAQVRFEAKSKYGPVMSFWLRMPRERSIQFLITELEFKATLNGDKGAEMGRIAFDTPFRRGDVEHFEVAAVGDRFVARFKGKQLSFQCPEANRNGSALFHGQSYAVKDVEYAILDGIPDPLKALGWEVDASTVTNSGWKDFMAELESGPYANPQLKAVWQREAGGWRVAKHHTFTLPDDAGRDMSIRASGTGSLYVFARSNKEQSGYEGRLFKEGFAKIQKGEQVLKHVPLGSQFDPAKPHQIELRLSKNVLTLSLDGAEIISLEDRSLTPGGRFGVSGSEGALIEKVEYRFLDESSASQTQSMPDSKAAADAKKLLVEARAHLKAGDLAETRKLVETALTTTPGDLTTQAEAALILAEAQAPERALSLANDFVRNASAEHPQFAATTEARVKLMPKMREYRARLDAAAKLVTANDDAGELRELQAALKILPDGREAADRLEMNPLHAGHALPGRKFANELGNTFVPVDGLPNVLFSTWETRVKDFEQFVKETGHDMRGLEPYDGDKTRTWQKPGFEQTGDHPVVLVSRQDAEAFCRWLTEKERKAGRLLPGQVYRLPTDREWSAAMGVLDEPGDFPADRKFPENVFTWPKGSAPPRNAENLNWTNDDFRFTAPVGSGAANSFGIYDLLGNVAEICADPWGIADPNGHDAAATIRGSAYQSELKVWRHRQDDSQAGSKRIGSANVGCRCVLDLKTEELRATQTRMEEAVASLRALDAAQNRPAREIITLVNDEMVLMDLRRWRHLNEEESRRLAGLPLTRLMFSTSERKGRLEVLKTFPLQVLRMALEVEGDHSQYLLDNVKGLPLTHVNITQHHDMGMALKSLDFLAGAPLRQLYLVGFTNLESIEPLRGMPLETLSFYGSTARLDLTPVKDAPLRRLSLPRSVSLEQFLDICEWWGAKLVQVESDGAAFLSRFFREAALTGQPAKVQEVKETLSKKLAAFPAFKGWLNALNSATNTNIDLCMIAARFIGGDATAFDGQFQVFAGHSYLFWPEWLSFDEAKELSARLGGHLATITSKEENEFIIQQMEVGVFQRNFTLGLERTGKGRMDWRWVTGEPLAYHNWGPESGMGGDCANFVYEKSQWVWFHGSMNVGGRFIIEWDTPTPQPPVKK